MSVAGTVEIRYRRPPDREVLFRQVVVDAGPACVVTYLPACRLGRPLAIDGAVILEDGAPAVWFTFPGAWHDIGRFHRKDGTFTGFYANVLTPVSFAAPGVWETTDLFLDIWLGADGALSLLDEDELAAAEEAGSVRPAVAEMARIEAERICRCAAAGSWPPSAPRHWTLERVRAALG